MAFDPKKILKCVGSRGTVLAVSFALAMPVAVTLHAQEPAAATAEQGAKPQTVLNETDAYRMSPAVTKLGAMVGMGPETAANVFTIFNIVVLFGAVIYGAAKALPKVFKTRSSAIQKHLVDARTATEEAQARLGSVEARLSKLDEQIAAMKVQAEADALREELRIKASVEEEQKKIVAAAEAEIHNATTLARREIQKYAAELAIDQAAKSLVVTAETDKLLVESFAARLGLDTHGGSKN
jgi:F-type H+-transporting ATPase subunit b